MKHDYFHDLTVSFTAGKLRISYFRDQTVVVCCAPDWKAYMIQGPRHIFYQQDKDRWQKGGFGSSYLFVNEASVPPGVKPKPVKYLGVPANSYSWKFAQDEHEGHWSERTDDDVSPEDGKQVVSAHFRDLDGSACFCISKLLRVFVPGEMPLEVICHHCKGEQTTDFKTISISHQVLDDAMFKVPAGFRKVNSEREIFAGDDVKERMMDLLR